MTLFDLIAGATIVLSTLAGVNAGGLREVIGLTAFALAAGAAVLLLPVTRPLARASLDPDWAAAAAAFAVVFLALYIGLRLGAGFAAGRLRVWGGPLDALDRTAGGGFGLLRAGVLLGGAYLLYQAAMPAGLRPLWIERAALLPAARTAGNLLRTVAPKGVGEAGALAEPLRNALAGSDFGDAAASDEWSETSNLTAPARQEPATRRTAAHNRLNVKTEYRR